MASNVVTKFSVVTNFRFVNTIFSKKNTTLWQNQQISFYDRAFEPVYFLTLCVFTPVFASFLAFSASQYGIDC